MESLVHYSSPAHAVSLLGVLNEQRLKAQLCDVVLMVGERRFPAHRSVLAASSEYFSALFCGRDSDVRDAVQLDFCEPEAFEMVLNYIYSSSLLVDRGSLAVIQELGYSFGIPFLTNIISARPQASYCVTRKKLRFDDPRDDSFTQRSVIVHQAGLGVAHRADAVQRENVSGRVAVGRDRRPSGCVTATEMGINLSRDGVETLRGSRAATPSCTSALKGGAPSTRPQLTSSVSFSETVQHLNFDSGDEPTDELKPDQGCDSGRGTQRRALNQTVDRSGPLIKSLLRRSLSMDSPVPVFSPVLELKDSQTRAQPLAESETSALETPESKHHLAPLVLGSKRHNAIHMEDKDTQVNKVRVKTEASSPLADPTEIIQVTVEDELPVSFHRFQTNFEENPRGHFGPPVKRQLGLDGDSNLCKRPKAVSERRFTDEDAATTEYPLGPDLREPGELKPSKMFKCWSCMKVFRSNAGLYRHVNMYHNPEKPYACDICHKRFHTNFKVWTHCQTQHGVLQNPAASSSSYSVLDEKFQRKLVDIVREREIKKALIMKLRRNKQGHQAQPFSKKSRRSRSYACPYCGKMFFFQSHFKLHMKGHTAERASTDARDDDDGLRRRAGPVGESQEREVFSCRLCNAKLSSASELEEHELACRYATVCPYCGLRFSSALVKKDHESHCKYKKLTCLECMRTFKTSFSIWRHRVEVHNQNVMSLREQLTLGYRDADPETPEPALAEDAAAYGDSEDSSSYLPEDLSSGRGKLVVKEEPQEEAVTDRSPPGPGEASVRPCEKCGKLFASHRALERHQELLCHIKPFICHVCHKAFRTNFRLWSHYQSHMTSAKEPADGPPHSPPPSPTPIISTQEPPSSRASPPAEEEEPRSPTSSLSNPEKAEQKKPCGGDVPGWRSDSAESPATSQDSDTLFYHAPPLSALTFKRQYMCKLCHRTFKTAFSLWSHEQTHAHV